MYAKPCKPCKYRGLACNKLQTNLIENTIEKSDGFNPLYAGEPVFFSDDNRVATFAGHPDYPGWPNYIIKPRFAIGKQPFGQVTYYEIEVDTYIPYASIFFGVVCLKENAAPTQSMARNIQMESMHGIYSNGNARRGKKLIAKAFNTTNYWTHTHYGVLLDRPNNKLMIFREDKLIYAIRGNYSKETRDIFFCVTGNAHQVKINYVASNAQPTLQEITWDRLVKKIRQANPDERENLVSNLPKSMQERMKWFETHSCKFTRPLWCAEESAHRMSYLNSIEGDIFD